MKHEQWIPGYTTTDLRGQGSRCPYCRKFLDMATCSHKDLEIEPRPGCPTVCAECGEICVFNERLRLRKPTAGELIELQRSNVWPHLERLARYTKAQAAREFTKKGRKTG